MKKARLETDDKLKLLGLTRLLGVLDGSDGRAEECSTGTEPWINGEGLNTNCGPSLEAVVTGGAEKNELRVAWRGWRRLL